MSWCINNAAQRHVGLIRHWVKDKGYGFIGRQNGEPDAFFHAKDLTNFSRPVAGDKVAFTLITDSKDRSRHRAVEVELIE
jgi:cold shock CspA family protein